MTLIDYCPRWSGLRILTTQKEARYAASARFMNSLPSSDSINHASLTGIVNIGSLVFGVVWTRCSSSRMVGKTRLRVVNVWSTCIAASVVWLRCHAVTWVALKVFLHQACHLRYWYCDSCSRYICSPWCSVVWWHQLLDLRILLCSQPTSCLLATAARSSDSVQTC